jgi:hypothetical protein
LIIFADLIFITGFQNPLKTALVRLIIFLDCLWVIVSLVVVLMGLFGLSYIGYSLIAVVALWVALMAFLQNKFLTKLMINTN